MLEDTIAAISTPLARGAICIVRLSGSDSFSILKKISDIKEIKPNTITYSHIYDLQGKIVDEVLVSCFAKGKSYTREDMVEINTHGGIFVSRKVLEILLSCGARLAENGEFSKRAYLNGRISLAQADGANDLISASNDLQARSAINALSGSIARLLNPLLLQMKDVISMIEVNIDYPEYEDERQMSNEVIKPYVLKWIKQAKQMIDKAERLAIVKDGLKTVIIGKPNVGKSSLLNALLDCDKAIVTPIAGTTRDLVEGQAILDNITLNLIDTAGIHQSQGDIEKIGIEKSKQAAKDADLILLVLDSNNIDSQDEQLIAEYNSDKCLLVYNKSDLKKHEGINICAKDKDISQLVDYLNEKYRDDLKLADQDVLNNQRQIACMQKCLTSLESMLDNIDYSSADLLEVDLMAAYESLCEIEGREYREDLIDHMFKNFCLGK